MHRVIQKDKSWVTDKAMCYFQRLKCVWYAVVKQFTGRNFRVHPKSIRKLGRPYWACSHFVGSRIWLLTSGDGITVFDLSFDLSEMLGIFCTVVCGMNGTQGAQQWLCILPWTVGGTLYHGLFFFYTGYENLYLARCKKSLQQKGLLLRSDGAYPQTLIPASACVFFLPHHCSSKFYSVGLIL